MRRKLIEMHQEYSIECDNEQCDYKIKSPTGDPNEDISGYVNTPCPQCGENLLTEQDHVQSLKLLGIINWLNKWFSWLTVFVPKKTKLEKISVHCHDGVTIEKSANP
jgi:predicted RNA-binding Zn-ribbon protein involved in translation (DUF1610 family)